MRCNRKTARQAVTPHGKSSITLTVTKMLQLRRNQVNQNENRLWIDDKIKTPQYQRTKRRIFIKVEVFEEL